MGVEFAFNPELRLMDGTIIRNVEDALVFARAQETRPGVDERDEVLHLLERARTAEDAETAGVRFRDWLLALEILDQRP